MSNLANDPMAFVTLFVLAALFAVVIFALGR